MMEILADPFEGLVAEPASHSKGDLIYMAIRREVVQARLLPGTVIDRAALCRRYLVSRFPVADALSRLAREGLVVIEPQKASTVAPLDEGEITAAFVLRRAIEVEACLVIAENGHVPDLSGLRARLAEMEAAAAAGDLDAFQERDAAFHGEIVRLVDLPRFAEVHAVPNAHLERLRHLTLPSRGRTGEVLAQHEAILDALAAGDGPKAAAAMRAHLEQFRAAVRDLAAARPELFVGGA
jgi:DNA-binding GntR family transcriptional regulator